MSKKFRYSAHALEEMARRGIPVVIADAVLQKPGQIVHERAARKAYQSIMVFEPGRTFLVRLIVDDATEPAVVVTAYRTSKISKYWRTS